MRPRVLLLLLASALILLGALAFAVWWEKPTVEKQAHTAAPRIAQPLPPKQLGAEVSNLLAKAVTFSDAAPRARIEMVQALAALGPGSETALSNAMRRAETPLARAVIADALGRLGTSESIDQLLAHVASTQNAAERRELVRAFDTIPPGQALETLASSLVMPQEPDVRDGIIATIARAAHPETVEFLSELYREPVAVAGQTESILAAVSAIHNPEATPALEVLLRESGELPLMEAAARALAKTGTPESLQALANAIDRVGNTNPAFRELLLRNVESVDKAEAQQWLEQAAHNAQTDPGLARAASEALAAVKAKKVSPP
ncbi:MAG: HEAT repeat domain-containing protein [Roseimicrobium sp.]